MPNTKFQKGVISPLILVLVAVVVVAVIGMNFLSSNKSLPSFSPPIANTPVKMAPKVNLSFSPDQVSVQANETFSVDVKIAGGEAPVTGAQLALKWDPTVLSATSMVKGSFLKGEFAPVAIDNKAGGALYTLNVGVTCTNALKPDTCTPNSSGVGDGVLATVKFKVLKNITEPTMVTINSGQTVITSTASADNVLGNVGQVNVTAGDITPKVTSAPY